MIEIIKCQKKDNAYLKLELEKWEDELERQEIIENIRGYTIEDIAELLIEEDCYITTVYGDCTILDYNLRVYYVTDLIDIFRNGKGIRDLLEKLIEDGSVSFIGFYDDGTFEEVEELEKGEDITNINGVSFDESDVYLVNEKLKERNLPRLDKLIEKDQVMAFKTTDDYLHWMYIDNCSVVDLEDTILNLLDIDITNARGYLRDFLLVRDDLIVFEGGRTIFIYI